MKIDTALFKSVALIRAALSRKCLVRGDIEKQRKIGDAVSHCDNVDRLHEIEPEPSRECLISKRRIDITIAKYDLAFLSCRQDLFPYQLRARCRI